MSKVEDLNTAFSSALDGAHKRVDDLQKTVSEGIEEAKTSIASGDFVGTRSALQTALLNLGKLETSIKKIADVLQNSTQNLKE